MQRTLAVALALSIVLPSAAGAGNPVLPGIRPLGMGNAFVGIADDRNSLYYNPAGLGNVDRLKLSGLALQAGVDNEFFEVVRFIQDHEEQFSNFDSIDQEFYDSLARFDDKWVAADANAYVDVTRTNLGIGVYTTGRLQFKIDRGVYDPRVSANVADDIVALVGGAMDLGRWDLRVGGTLKGIWRRETTRTLSAVEVADFDLGSVLDDLEAATGGFGMDLGVWWQRDGTPFTVGAVLRDAPGFVGSEPIGAAFDLGAAWYPLDRPVGPICSLVVGLDVRDGFSEGPLGTKLHLGAEVGLPFVALRTGFHQGYPSVGLSVGGRIASLDYAFYGRELGEFPGAEAQFLHALEANLGF